MFDIIKQIYLNSIFYNKKISSKVTSKLEYKPSSYLLSSIVKVRTYTTISKGRSTSTAVHSYAIQRSKGICESCETPAPFETRNGTPYLEVHHLIPISKGGPDHPENVAAVCPNCHRRTEKSQDSDEFNNAIIKRILQKEKKLGII